MKKLIFTLALVLVLTGCASKPDVKVVTEVMNRWELPPVEWLTIPPKVEKNYTTNGELYLYSEKQDARLLIMEANLMKLQEWRDQVDARDRKQDKRSEESLNQNTERGFR